MTVIQLVELLLQGFIIASQQGCKGQEAQSAPGQGANQQQLQQMALSIDRAATVFAGSIDSAPPWHRGAPCEG